MKSLAKTLKGKGIKTLSPDLQGTPFWKGPEEDGITQSMLNDFMFCRERFRVRTILGLGTADRFNKSIEYGNLWHICEEHLAKRSDWKKPLQDYTKVLIRKYPLEQAEVLKWYNVCLIQFPVYVEYWKAHPDVKNRTPLLQEEVFRIPYQLPSGRTVHVKGKFDSVDFIRSEGLAGIYLQENKTKGDIDEASLQKNLRFDLQTMFYLNALVTGAGLGTDVTSHWPDEFNDQPILGVRYNVVRRPLSGGKGSIRQHQPTKSNPQGESLESFYSRLLNDYIRPEPEYWFKRWKTEISRADLEAYQDRFLNPILEQLCEWYDHVSVCYDRGMNPFTTAHPKKYIHFQCPYGVYNPISEGYATDLDEYLASGSRAGLVKIETLFPELESE